MSTENDEPLLDFCPHCGVETKFGYGLAGGGMGVYRYCENEECGKYFAKIQEKDDE